MRRKIVISAEDHRQLESLLNSEYAAQISGAERVGELRAELERAEILATDDFPKDVVRMNSTIALRDLDTNELETYKLVYPKYADIANDKLSVLAPVGTGILGYRVGDEVRWRVPQGWRRFRVEQVEFEQPSELAACG